MAPAEKKSGRGRPRHRRTRTRGTGKGLVNMQAQLASMKAQLLRLLLEAKESGDPDKLEKALKENPALQGMLQRTITESQKRTDDGHNSDAEDGLDDSKGGDVQGTGAGLDEHASGDDGMHDE